MDEYLAEHLRNLYGMNPNIPHMAFQFPRLPPGKIHPGLKTPNDPTIERFTKNIASTSENLQSFQLAYQMQASNLLTNKQIMFPGHPLYANQNLDALKAENDKLIKENIELKKKIEKQSNNN